MSYLRGCAAVRTAGQFIVLSCLSTDIWNQGGHNLFSLGELEIQIRFQTRCWSRLQIVLQSVCNFFCVSIYMYRISLVFIFQPFLTYPFHSVLHRFVSTAVTENVCGISGFIAVILDESNMLLSSCF